MKRVNRVELLKCVEEYFNNLNLGYVIYFTEQSPELIDSSFFYIKFIESSSDTDLSCYNEFLRYNLVIEMYSTNHVEIEKMYDKLLFNLKDFNCFKLKRSFTETYRDTTILKRVIYEINV